MPAASHLHIRSGDDSPVRVLPLQGTRGESGVVPCARFNWMTPRWPRSRWSFAAGARPGMPRQPNLAVF